MAGSSVNALILAKCHISSVPKIVLISFSFHENGPENSQTLLISVSFHPGFWETQEILHNLNVWNRPGEGWDWVGGEETETRKPHRTSPFPSPPPTPKPPPPFLSLSKKNTWTLMSTKYIEASVFMLVVLYVKRKLFTSFWMSVFKRVSF